MLPQNASHLQLRGRQAAFKTFVFPHLLKEEAVLPQEEPYFPADNLDDWKLDSEPCKTASSDPTWKTGAFWKVSAAASPWTPPSELLHHAALSLTFPLLSLRHHAGTVQLHQGRMHFEAP